MDLQIKSMLPQIIEVHFDLLITPEPPIGVHIGRMVKALGGGGSLTSNQNISYVSDDLGIFWGVKFYNDMLLQGGLDGNLQSETVFRRDESFMLNNGWAFQCELHSMDIIV